MVDSSRSDAVVNEDVSAEEGKRDSADDADDDDDGI